MKITLSKPLARNGRAEEFDVRQIKKALNRLGYYMPDKESGITGIPDDMLFTAITLFQKERGFSLSGRIQPGDPTLIALSSENQKKKSGQFIWRSVGDERVRPEHAELDGTVRDFSDSPDPGDEFNCRCWAEPVKDPKNKKDKCADLEHQLAVALSRLDSLQKSLAEAVEAHNTALEEWKKAQDELYKITAEAGLAIGIPEKGAWDIAAALITGALQIPGIQEARDKVDRARTNFEGAQNVIMYLQRDIEEINNEIDSIKTQMEILGC